MLIALSSLALAASSLGWLTSAHAAGGIAVSVTGATLSVQAPASIVPQGDIVLTGSASTLYVYVDPDSQSALTLSPGGGCQEGSPPGIEAGAGTAVVCSGRFDLVTINLMLASFPQGPAAFAIGDSLTLPINFFGSFDRDEFYGGNGPDVILGYGGDDAIFGGGDDDSLFGGDGADTIDGERGSDTIFGDAGADDITADDDARAVDWVNCNNWLPGVIGTNNPPGPGPYNDVSFDKGADRITDCGEPGSPAVKTAPRLSGVPTVSRAYTAMAGEWTGQALKMSYAWFSCPNADDSVPFLEEDPAGKCAQVQAKDGAPGLTYTPKASDVGKVLKLRSTARNNAGYWTVVTPASPKVVRARR